MSADSCRAVGIILIHMEIKHEFRHYITSPSPFFIYCGLIWSQSVLSNAKYVPRRKQNMPEYSISLPLLNDTVPGAGSV